MQAVVEEPRHLAGPVRVEVSPADVADEQRVAGEHADGVVPGGAVPHRDRDALVGVPRGVQDRQLARANREGVPVLRPLAIPEVQGRAVVHRGTDPFAQRLGAGHEVLVAVSLEDVGYAHVVLPGRVEVGLDVEPRVDDRGLAAVVQEVGDVGQARGLDGGYVHRSRSGEGSPAHGVANRRAGVCKERSEWCS